VGDQHDEAGMVGTNDLRVPCTSRRRGQLPDLELRQRRRARAEDRIRAAKDTGLHNFPLHGFDQNRVGAPSCNWPSN
jgi:hypothetical protein